MPGDNSEELTDWREARPPFVLALDVGTSSVRAALYDSRAAEVAGTRARLAHEFCTTAEGGAEADAEGSFAHVVRVVDEALARVRGAAREAGEARGDSVPLRVEALAVSCFWHSLLGLSREGRALTPVYGWADTRAAAQAARLREQLDERVTHARTGCRFHASYWPAKLRWIQEERADAWRASARFVSFGELLALRLCGAARASASMASGTGLFDQRARAWDEPLAASLGLDLERLPALAQDGEAFALQDEFAARWPVLRGARVFPAVGDGAANNVGEGCTSRARAALMVGTSGAMRVAYEGDSPRELDESLWCYRVDDRRVVVGGALSDGGGLFGWLASALALTPEVERDAASLAPDAHGLTVLPFWSGERSTGWNPFATGAILGLRAHTRPAEIVRAAMEAVAYRFALVARALDPHAPRAEVRASGGALRASRAWAQVLADTLGRPVRLSRVGEASSRGAVLLALEAMGAIKSVDELEAPAGDALTPDPARQEIYRRGLERQQSLYELLVGNQEVARLLATARAREADEGPPRCEG